MTIKDAIEANCRDGGRFYRISQRAMSPTCRYEFRVAKDGRVECHFEGHVTLHWALELPITYLLADDWANDPGAMS